MLLQRRLKALVVIYGLAALCMAGCGAKQLQSRHEAAAPQTQGTTATAESHGNTQTSAMRRLELDPSAKIPEAQPLPTGLKGVNLFFSDWDMPKYPGLEEVDNPSPDEYLFAVRPDKGSLDQIMQFYLHHIRTTPCVLDEANSYYKGNIGYLRCKHPKRESATFTISVAPPEEMRAPEYRDGRTYVLMTVSQR